MQAIQILVNQTRREVARTIVKSIGDWLERPEANKGTVIVYLDTDGITDTYSVQNPPFDHLVDIFTITEWTFGDRDESVEDIENEPLSDDEASALIDVILDQWMPENVDFEGQYVPLVYADDN